MCLFYSSIGRVHSGGLGMAAGGQNMKLADHVLSTHRKQREEEANETIITQSPPQ